MLEKIAHGLTAFTIKQGVIPEEDSDIYIYGWSLILSTLGSTIMMLLLGALTGQFFGTCLYLIYFVSLRVIAGGYHADTYLKCFILTMSWYGSAFAVVYFLPEHLYAVTIVVLTFISLLITFFFAPVAHPNKPLSERRKDKFKRMSRIIVSIQTILSLSLLLFVGPPSYHFILWAALGAVITSITLLVVIIFSPYERSKKR